MERKGEEALSGKKPTVVSAPLLKCMPHVHGVKKKKKKKKIDGGISPIILLDQIRH